VGGVGNTAVGGGDVGEGAITAEEGVDHGVAPLLGQVRELLKAWAASLIRV